MNSYYTTTVDLTNGVSLRGKYRAWKTQWGEGDTEIVEVHLILPDGKEIKLDEHNIPHQIRDLLDSSEPDYFGDLDDKTEVEE